MMLTYQHTLEHVSKHHDIRVLAAEQFRASLGLVWVKRFLNELLSTDVNVPGHAGTDTIYWGNTI
jgi:hypothetical protein